MTTYASSMTRRSFIKTVAGAAFTVNVIPAMALLAAETDAIVSMDNQGWSAGPGKARYRIDGLAKVTGERIYASDFRASVMPGWPKSEQPVMIVRATDMERLFTGLRLALLPAGAQPKNVLYGDVITDTIVRPNDLERDVELDRREEVLRGQIGLPSDIRWPFIVPRGARANFYGQPVAFLIFASRAAFRAANKIVQFNPAFQIYEGAAPPQPNDLIEPLTNFVRVAGPAGGEDVFSYARNGWDADYTENADKFRWLIDREIESGKWKTYSTKCTMQAMDPMFMEPESGLAWYDARTLTLNLVVGTQSPEHDVSSTLAMFAGPNSPVAVKTVNLVACYPGGGFGGRDKSVFTLNLAIAAVYGDGKPVRLAYNRFEQFQAGLKRHACDLTEKLAVDDQGNIQALSIHMAFDGGGRKNLSPYVAQLAGLCAGGSYDIPNAAISSEAKYSTNVSGGSQRGFGGPQAFFAIEILLDEAARDLGQTPFDLRRRNIIGDGGKTVAGGPVKEKLRLDEILNRAEKHPVWQDRKMERELWLEQGLLYGVGYAMSMEAYGTSGDGLVGYVEIDKAGNLAVRTDAVDMGNGSATTLAVSTAGALGGNAVSIEMGDPNLFDQLQMKVGSKTGDWSDPDWTKKDVASSSACMTAFHQVHAVEQASQVLFDTAILPAARRLWGAPDISAKNTRWVEGSLTAFGWTRDLPALPIKRLAENIYDSNGVGASLVHAYFQEIWVEADYEVYAGTTIRWAIDGVALYKVGSPLPERVRRTNGSYPSEVSAHYNRTTFAPCGNLIGLTVDGNSGEVVVRKSVSILSAGRIITEGLVSGQSQGGVAMAIGYTLMEDMPPGPDGPAGGDWNLNRYHVPLARDVALRDQELITLPPLEGDRTAKGIGEAVMCSIAPAISNALYDATGRRFRDLPITAAKIREALKTDG